MSLLTVSACIYIVCISCFLQNPSINKSNGGADEALWQMLKATDTKQVLDHLHISLSTHVCNVVSGLEIRGCQKLP